MTTKAWKRHRIVHRHTNQTRKAEFKTLHKGGLTAIVLLSVVVLVLAFTLESDERLVQADKQQAEISRCEELYQLESSLNVKTSQALLSCDRVNKLLIEKFVPQQVMDAFWAQQGAQ